MRPRRRFLIGAAAAALPFVARAQSMPRIGFLVSGDPEPAWTLFRKGMAGLGYVEGRNIAYQYRSAAASSGRLDALAAELVGLKVDLLVAVLSPAIAAARRATSTIPIVFFGAAPDTGMVKNVARPEGNITGAFSPSSALAGKAVQLFHEIRPQTRTFGALLNALDPFHVPLQRDVEAAARAEKIELVPALINTHEELLQAFDAMAGRGADGVLVQPSLGLDESAALALQHRLPAISFRREFVEKGGLLSYGADQAALNRLAAAQVDKILKGAKPIDVPVQQSTQYELVVNQKTAKLLGFTFPPVFLARVDEVIE